MAGMFDDLIPQQSAAPQAKSGGAFNDLIPQPPPSAAPQPAPATPFSPVSDAANWYLNGVANSASAGARQVGNAMTPTPEYAASIQRDMNASPFDITGGLQRFGITSRAIGNAISGAGQIASSWASPLVSKAGQALDAVMPSFTHEDRQKLAASGVRPYSGEEIINTALMGLRPGNATPAGLVTKPPSISAADVKTAATNVYNNAAVKGTAIPRQAVNNAMGQAAGDLRTFRPSGGTDAFSILDEIRNANNPVRGKNGQFQKTTPITADNLDEWSGTLGHIAGETQLNAQGLPQPTPRAAAATILKNKVDDLLATHAPGWAEADANYAAAKTAQGLDRRSIIAEIKAGGGGDYASKLAQQAKTILLDPRVTSKYSPENIAKLKSISQGGGVTQQTLNWAGTKLGSRISHGAGALIGGLLGASHGGAEGAVVGGTLGSIGDALLAKGLLGARNNMANKQVQSLVNSVLQGSPYGRAMAPLPVSPPNPLLGSIPVWQFPQAIGAMGMRPLMPSYANGQQ